MRGSRSRLLVVLVVLTSLLAPAQVSASQSAPSGQPAAWAALHRAWAPFVELWRSLTGQARTDTGPGADPLGGS
jgi:hypothetical protein